VRFEVIRSQKSAAFETPPGSLQPIPTTATLSTWLEVLGVIFEIRVIEKTLRLIFRPATNHNETGRFRRPVRTKLPDVLLSLRQP
jgi:hypothetical protein